MSPEFAKPSSEIEPPQPDFWFELAQRQPETPVGIYRNWFLGTRFPITYQNIGLIGRRLAPKVSVHLDNETIRQGFEESGNLVGYMHWQKEQTALNFTGIGFGGDQGLFYDGVFGELVPLKEVRKLKRQQQRTLTARFLAKVGL